MSIRNYIDEIKNLNIELKRLNKASAIIRKNIKDVEKNIIDYLDQKEQPGVKYQDFAVIVENKTKHTSKKKKDIEEDSLRILEEYGISNPQSALKEILEARRGEEVDNKKLKIKKIK